MSDFRTDYENYLDKWDKAQKSGVFDDAEKPANPDSRNEPQDFLSSTHRASPSDEINTEKYWARLHNAARRGAKPSDVTEEDEDEQEEDGSGRLDEDDQEVSVNPNPVHWWTLGKDQDLVAASVGLSGIDFLRLEQMKKDLHEMISKVNEADARGNSGQAKSVMTKIKSLKDRIDDLSDTLSYERLKKPRSR